MRPRYIHLFIVLITYYRPTDFISRQSYFSAGIKICVVFLSFLGKICTVMNCVFHMYLIVLQSLIVDLSDILQYDCLTNLTTLIF